LIAKLRNEFNSIKKIFEAKTEKLMSLGMNREKAEKLRSGKILSEASNKLEQLKNNGYKIITIEDKQYPQLLREIYDPPIVLYCSGKVEVLNSPCIAIVGTRRPTPYGRAVAENLSFELSLRGLTIVSGLAKGIDSYAHYGVLKAEGNTVAVLGTGIDVVYPRQNFSLYKKIKESGVIITEFPLGSPPLNYHFPIRNRIISGISLGVVVVEAADRSGSLITARLALDQCREVMAVPGNVTSKFSKGTNWLIKNGAKLVSCWEDVVEELPLQLKEEILSKEKKSERTIPKLSLEEEKVLNALKQDEKIHIDLLSENTGYSVSELLSYLLSLELKDLVIQYPGKYYQRKIV
jgi:DNA processing protein